MADMPTLRITSRPLLKLSIMLVVPVTPKAALTTARLRIIITWALTH